MSRRRYRGFEPAIVAAMDAPPAWSARIVTLVIVLFAAVAAVWLHRSSVEIVVSARGEIVPAGRARRVQAAGEGVIRTLQVRDGQRVAAGSVLMELDDTASVVDAEAQEARRLRAQLAIQRLQAELGEADVIGAGTGASGVLVAAERRRLAANMLAFQERVAQLESEVARAEAAVDVATHEIELLRLKTNQVERQRDDRRDQAARGLVPAQEVVELDYTLESTRKELEIGEQRAREARGRLAAARDAVEAARGERRSSLLGALSEASREYDAASRELVKAHDKTRRQRVLSPVDGIVQEMAVNTVGGVVERGQVLMSIVPEDAPMEMNIRVADRDIGFVAEGQPVKIKIDAFEYTRYGAIDGTLEWVGSDAIVDEREGPVYPARVVLASTELPNRVRGRVARIAPGMRALADIVIGERWLLDYFLTPLKRYRDESLRER